MSLAHFFSVVLKPNFPISIIFSLQWLCEKTLYKEKGTLIAHAEQKRNR